MEDALHEKGLLSFFKENLIVATHLIQTNNLIVEIDADVLDAAFYFLKEQHPNTFLSPDQKMYNYYISPQEENVIVNQLHVDASLNKVNDNFYTPKLEKLLIESQGC